MHRNPTPQTRTRRNHHPTSKCTGILPLEHECSKIGTPQVYAPESYPSSSKFSGILPLTHECTIIVIPQVNALESYPSHMNATKSSLLNNAPEFYPSHINALKSSILRSMHWNPAPHTWMHWNHNPSGKCTGILPLTHEFTEIVIPQVNAPESYPSHMNAPKHHPSWKSSESYPSHMNASKLSPLK